jgi:predicted HTH domain antitoxin
MKQELLEVNVPKELLLGVDKNKFIDDMKLFTAIKLYERNVLSLGKAAVLAERDLGEFMEILSEHGVDVIKYPKEELNEEIKFLRTV